LRWPHVVALNYLTPSSLIALEEYLSETTYIVYITDCCPGDLNSFSAKTVLILMKSIQDVFSFICASAYNGCTLFSHLDI